MQETSILLGGSVLQNAYRLRPEDTQNQTLRDRELDLVSDWPDETDGHILSDHDGGMLTARGQQDVAAFEDGRIEDTFLRVSSAQDEEKKSSPN
jgi:hypothetical protein